jgi:hypothetical protein
MVKMVALVHRREALKVSVQIMSLKYNPFTDDLLLLSSLYAVRESVSVNIFPQFVSSVLNTAYGDNIRASFNKQNGTSATKMTARAALCNAVRHRTDGCARSVCRLVLPTGGALCDARS